MPFGLPRFPLLQRFSGKCQGAARRQARFPLTPSENAAWGYVVAQRLDAPHFSTGGVAPYVAEVFSAIALKTSCYPP